jgi:hypothetical protein
LIIVEGVDGAGKTTLAQALAQHLGTAYMRPPEHLLSSTVGPGDGLTQWWIKELQENRIPDVYDRCTFISDPIYSTVMGRPPSCPANAVAYMLDLSKEAVSHFIFCMPSKDHIWANFHEDRPNLVGMNRSKMKRIMHLYEVHLNHYRLMFPTKVMVYNWYGKDYTMDKVRGDLGLDRAMAE